MDINSLLLGIDACECGMSHKCPIEHVIIEKDVCKNLPELTRSYNNILLVADKNTYAACGRAAEIFISEKIAEKLIYNTIGILVPDENAIRLLQSKVNDKTDLIIGVGSGVINDLCKIVSYQNNLPYFIIATAPSMDGYASKGSALILDGMKVTLNANVPMAILADINVLANAPMEMIQAGYGDIIGKYSCLNDWRLSACVNGEYICEKVMKATYDTVEDTVKLSEGIKTRSPDAIGELMKALVAVGILMAYVGNSRPASGSEHHLSHYFEIVGIVRGEQYLPHGIDVCFSAIETAKLRERLLSFKDISDRVCRFDRDEYEKEIRRIYGRIADEVIALQNKMGWYVIDRVAVYREKWDEIVKILSDCPSAMRMTELCEKVGLNYENYLSLYGEDKIADALLYAKDLKDRYTVLWMNYDLR